MPLRCVEIVCIWAGRRQGPIGERMGRRKYATIVARAMLYAGQEARRRPLGMKRGLGPRTCAGLGRGDGWISDQDEDGDLLQ